MARCPIDISIEQSDSVADCVFCLAPLLDQEPTAECTTCAVRVHAECALELQRCPTLSCGGSFPTAAVEIKPTRRRWKRWAALVALGLVVGVVFLGWRSTQQRLPGEMARLGSWSAGHGSRATRIGLTFGLVDGFKLDAIAISRDGARVVTIQRKGKGIEWSTTGRVVDTFFQPSASSYESYDRWLGFREDGSLVGVCDGQVKFWNPGNIQTGELTLDLDEIRPAARLLDGWADGGRVLVAYGGKGTLVLEVSRGGSRQLASLPTGSNNLQFSADGTWAALSHWIGEGDELRHQVARWRFPDRLEPLWTTREENAPSALAVAASRSGQIAWLTGDGRLTIRAPDGQEAKYSLPGSSYVLSFSPNGALLALMAPDGVLVLSARDASIRHRFDTYARRLAWSPDGTWLATCGGDKASLWRVE